ncbi:MAG TPA: HAD-IIB family hydrolase [Candidatus Paceibacterota bacterium]|nr:HAD-IIB family hydrolase [Candidatus Paceibacterota bacterium]
MTKHFFFDLDGTLTPSRSEIRAQDVATFEQLCAQYDVVVVSGAQDSQMRKQLPERLNAKFYRLTQNGNKAFDPDGNEMWSEVFAPEQEKLVFATIEKWKHELAIAVRDENDLVEHRGSQISYSLIGHEEDRAKKAAYDPDGSAIKKILAQRPADVAALTEAGVEVTVAGTTCFDFFLLGKNKGFHVARLAVQKGWDKDECIYIGDALEPGRNDETVIGVLPTHAVKDPDDTFSFIKKMLD